MDLNTARARIHALLPILANPTEAETRETEMDQRIDDLIAALSAEVTEYRLTPSAPNFTPLIVRRDPAYDGTRWAILHDPGDLAVRRAWTEDGWEMAWSLSGDETYCWPDASTALTEAKKAQAEDEHEPDIDGAGRTRESYYPKPA